MGDFLKSPLFSAGIGFVLGLLASVLGVAFIEPFRARMAAYLEFGKWLAILPLELRQLQGMTRHIVVELAAILERAEKEPDKVSGVPHPIGEKLEVDTIMEIRRRILGWERTEDVYKLVTEIWSAVVRTNWSLSVYNEKMAELIASSSPENPQWRSARLQLVAMLHNAFVTFGVFVDEKVNVIEAELRAWDKSSPRVRDAFRFSLIPDWRSTRTPLSANIGFDKIAGMPYVEIVNLTRNEPLVVTSVVAFCGLPFFNNGLAFFPLETVRIPPKAPFKFRMDIWTQWTAIVQRKANADKTMNDAPFGKKDQYQVFRSIALMPKNESWIEVEFNGQRPKDFLRGNVKWAFEAAVDAASPENRRKLELGEKEAAANSSGEEEKHGN